MRIRTMRASGARLTAEVYIGEADNGSVVTSTVVLDRKSQDVIDAMTTLDNLVLREATARINAAHTRTEVERQVVEKLAPRLAEEKSRLERNIAAQIEERTREVQQSLTREADNARSRAAAAERKVESMVRGLRQALNDNAPERIANIVSNAERATA